MKSPLYHKKSKKVAYKGVFYASLLELKFILVIENTLDIHNLA